MDFIVYGRGLFSAIEVKHRVTVRRSDRRPLRSFHADYREAQRLLLYLGDEALYLDGVLCLSCGRFLRALDPRHGFPACVTSA